MRHLPVRHRESRVPSWLLSIIVLLLVVLCGGWFVRERFRSRVIGNPYRYNLVAALRDDSLVFVSFDPQEEQIFTVVYPRNLEIKSRSVGAYTLGSLYTLGTYDRDPATFVKRKVQGFMRVPIVGFLEARGDGDPKAALKDSLFAGFFRPRGATTLTRLDSLVLYFRSQKYEWRESGEADLVRANVIEKKGDVYLSNQERLKQFLGTKVFDWAVGQHRTTVAIVNESGEDGLAHDIAEFMSNLGMDIVAVKSSQDKKETTIVEYTAGIDENKAILAFMADFFGWTHAEERKTDEYRANFVIRLGKDAISLF